MSSSTPAQPKAEEKLAEKEKTAEKEVPPQKK